MWFIAAFVLLPVIEIVLFILIGGEIGVWAVLALLALGVVGGVLLLRWTGMQAMAELRGLLERGGDPAEPLVNRALLLAAAVLLIVPGFFTDAVALVLLIPPVRMAIFRALKSRVSVSGFGVNVTRKRWQDGNEDVIDGDFSRVEPEDPKLPRH